VQHPMNRVRRALLGAIAGAGLLTSAPAALAPEQVTQSLGATSDKHAANPKAIAFKPE
jgi:hypothetical protein